MFGLTVLEVVFLAVVAAIVAKLLLGFLQVLKIEGGERSRGMTAEETRTMQEIHQGLQKLDGRIEALETILLDRIREKEDK